jgi:hypothetical protein
VRGTELQLLAAITVALAVQGLAKAQSGCTTDRATISAQRGLIFENASVAPGQWYWKLTDVAWCLPEQNGFKINIFVRAMDANGNYITNQAIRIGYPHSYPNLPPNQLSVMTKAFPDWGDYPMSGGNWCPCWCPPTYPQIRGPYAAWVVSACPANGSSCPSQTSYPSDRVWGMGLPCNQHESYFLTWQFTQAAGPPEPSIVVEPTSFARQVSLGGNLSDDSFTVENGGGGTLNFSVSEGVNWLSVSPTSGNATGTDVRTITIDYSTASLPAGLHQATISVTGNAGNSPQTVQVAVDVHPPQYLGDMDLDLDVDQTDFGAFQACLTGAGVFQLLPSCERAKLDVDQDVDESDLSIFLGCMDGPDQTPPGACLE